MVLRGLTDAAVVGSGDEPYRDGVGILKRIDLGHVAAQFAPDLRFAGARSARENMRAAIPDAPSAAVQCLERVPHDRMDIEPSLRVGVIDRAKREDRLTVNLRDIGLHGTLSRRPRLSDPRR